MHGPGQKIPHFRYTNNKDWTTNTHRKLKVVQQTLGRDRDQQRTCRITQWLQHSGQADQESEVAYPDKHRPSEIVYVERLLASVGLECWSLGRMAQVQLLGIAHELVIYTLKWIISSFSFYSLFSWILFVYFSYYWLAVFIIWYN